jgi:membrane-bound lytic murein transglycosylase D
MKLRKYWWWGLLGAALTAVAEPPAPEDSGEDLYQAGKDLFEAYAPPEVKEQFAFPDKAQWDAFAARLQAVLGGDSLENLAAYEPEARAALAALRALPGGEEYTSWLEERLDYIEAAKQSVARPPVRPPAAHPAQFIPNYDLWVQRLQTRPAPAAAAKYVPLLQPVFIAGGVTGPLVWLAEVESGFNPTALSPVGARGLFQLMPATARELGLSTFLPDERTDPEKSAQAAARLLGRLHAKFHDWPLAIAAYNAGAGRVQRALDQHHARTFAEIASALSVETRLYVPKVLAILRVRAGLDPGALAAARGGG